MLTTLLVFACKPPEPAPLPTFEPVAVGFGFDGVITADGSVSGYAIEGDTFDPAVVLQFVSAAYAEATDDDVRQLESCVAVTTFDPVPLLPPDQIPTVGDAPLLVSYDTTLQLEATSCAGRADPEVWGENAEGLLDPFEGEHFGLGVGPLTDSLRATLPAETLTEIGPSLLALWVAMNDVDKVWVASDVTTVLAFEWEEETGELATAENEEGVVDLVLMTVDDLLPGDPLPPMYLQSYPAVFQDLESLGLE